MKYLAFDIEIAALLPEDVDDWKTYRPLGITCAAVAWQGSDAIKTQTFCGEDAEGHTTPRMTREECADVVGKLQEAVRRGYTLLTHNGLGFDFDVLAEESGMHRECADLALDCHVDTCLLAHCVKGFPVGLDAIAKGMKLGGKTEGMSGALAPQMWAEGKFDEVLAYVAQDAVATLEVAQAIEKRGGFSWIAKSGRLNHCNLPSGLMIASEALTLPEPNTSWMTDPIPRERFFAWTEAQPQPVSAPATIADEDADLWK